MLLASTPIVAPANTVYPAFHLPPLIAYSPLLAPLVHYSCSPSRSKTDGSGNLTA
jgi:hypothetical protein